MRAVALYKYLPIDHPESLVDVELPTPTPGPRELRVRVEAISVNPVDVKVRAPKDKTEAEPRVLGWDAAGVVDAVGSDVTLFKPGDEVFYAGSIIKPGTNAELHLVDERIVGPKPTSLSFAEAAALPLTSLTAWELLFERLGIDPGGPDQPAASGDALLITGAAGGVGSLAIQLAKLRTDLTVIATASRPESIAWCRSLGADHIIDHTKPLAPQALDVIPGGVKYVASLNATNNHFASLVELMTPFGRLGLIDDPKEPIDITKMKSKSLSLHWELMFTRSLYEQVDPITQHRILKEIARMVDAGQLRTTVGKDLGPINAANLRRAHSAIEDGHTVGKIVLSGFPS